MIASAPRMLFLLLICASIVACHPFEDANQYPFDPTADVGGSLDGNSSSGGEPDAVGVDAVESDSIASSDTMTIEPDALVDGSDVDPVEDTTPSDTSDGGDAIISPTLPEGCEVAAFEDPSITDVERYVCQYQRASGGTKSLYVYVSADDVGESRAVFMFFPGASSGPWFVTSDPDKAQGAMLYAARNGGVGVAVDYGSASQGEGVEMFTSGAFLENAADSVVWTHQTIGAFGGDSEHLVLGGFGAGGTIAMLMRADPPLIEGAELRADPGMPTGTGTTIGAIQGLINASGPLQPHELIEDIELPVNGDAAFLVLSEISSRLGEIEEVIAQDWPPTLLIGGGGDTDNTSGSTGLDLTELIARQLEDAAGNALTLPITYLQPLADRSHDTFGDTEWCYQPFSHGQLLQVINGASVGWTEGVNSTDPISSETPSYACGESPISQSRHETLRGMVKTFIAAPQEVYPIPAPTFSHRSVAAASSRIDRNSGALLFNLGGFPVPGDEGQTWLRADGTGTYFTDGTSLPPTILEGVYLSESRLHENDWITLEGLTVPGAVLDQQLVMTPEAQAAGWGAEIFIPSPYETQTVRVVVAGMWSTANFNVHVASGSDTIEVKEVAGLNVGEVRVLDFHGVSRFSGVSHVKVSLVPWQNDPNGAAGYPSIAAVVLEPADATNP